MSRSVCRSVRSRVQVGGGAAEREAERESRSRRDVEPSESTNYLDGMTAPCETQCWQEGKGAKVATAPPSNLAT